jgi:hypothetical protein
MSWEAPTFIEVRMDAEIGSYQDDFDPARDEPAYVANAGEESIRDLAAG